MKTSNKLLIGLLALALLAVTVVLGAAKYYRNSNTITGNDKLITEAREVADFTGLEVDGRVKVYLTQGSGTSLEVKADQNLLPEIITRVEDGILYIEVSNFINRNEEIEALVTIETIQSLDFAAGAYLEATNTLTGDEIKIESASGSEVNISLDYAFIDGHSSSGANLRLKGNAETATLDASSGAVINAEELNVKKCSVTGSSGALVNVMVQEELSAEVSSGGAIRYSGNPTIKNLNTSSGGTIKKK